MSDTNTNAAEANGSAPAAPSMRVIAQYIRDMSFENVLAQKGLSGNLEPEVEVAVALDAKKRPTENQYEVIQKYKITSKAKGSGETLFLMELEYGGVFEIQNVPEEQIHPYLLIECPRMIFPYVRRIVGDITRDGGFPALNMENVDFIQLYRQEIQRRAKAQSANNEPV